MSLPKNHPRLISNGLEGLSADEQVSTRQQIGSLKSKSMMRRTGLPPRHLEREARRFR